MFRYTEHNIGYRFGWSFSKHGYTNFILSFVWCKFSRCHSVAGYIKRAHAFTHAKVHPAVSGLTFIGTLLRRDLLTAKGRLYEVICRPGYHGNLQLDHSVLAPTDL